MLINFDQKIPDLDGKPYKDGEDGDEWTLATLSQVALTTPTDKNRDLPLKEKQDRANLAADIHAKQKLDVSAPDVTKILEAIAGLPFNFMMIRAVSNLFDPKPEEVKKEKAK